MAIPQEDKDECMRRRREYNREYGRKRRARHPEERKKRNEYSKEYRKKNKAKIREYNAKPEVALRRKTIMIRHNYGVPVEWYFAQLERQDNKCAVCGVDFSEMRQRDICVDHNHMTGSVRDILCSNCNHALGFIEDDPIRAEKLIAYLKKHGNGS